MRRRYSMFRPETHEILRELARARGDVRPAATPSRRGVLARRRAVGRLLRRARRRARPRLRVHAHACGPRCRRRCARSSPRSRPRSAGRAWPCWTGSNHDIGRLATRWATGDDARVRCALMLLLTLRGTPCLYYGDEIAPRRPVTFRRSASSTSRDAFARPRSDTDAVDGRRRLARPVASARATRAATSRSNAPTASRRCSSHATSSHYGAGTSELRSGRYVELRAPEGAWAWRRGESVIGRR